MRSHGVRYAAVMLSTTAVVALLGSAEAYSGHHAADLPDLLWRVAVLMVPLCLAGSWLIYRPVGRYAASPGEREPPASYIRRLPLLSAAWVSVLAAATVASYLGSSHGSWAALAGEGVGALSAMFVHVGAFAAYIGLFAYFLVAEYVVGLRLHLWSAHGAVLPPSAGRIAFRIVLGIVAVGLGPLVLLLSIEPAGPAPQSLSPHHALLRQALDLNLFAAALLSIMLVYLIARGVSRPVESLLAAMRRVEAGQLDMRAPVISDDELGRLAAGFNTMVGGLADRERMRRTFGRFVPEEVAAALLAEEGAIAPQEREATVLFTDIERFTQIASRLAPREVLDMLNEYFATLAAIIQSHGGVITQFQGDAVLAVFNLPAPVPDHARRALDAARKILDVVPRTRVGISTGKVVGGVVGGAERLGYTVHGDTVNLAARLEALNKQLGSRVLVDERTAALLGEGHRLVDRGRAAVRGFGEPLRVYEARSAEQSSGPPA